MQVGFKQSRKSLKDYFQWRVARSSAGLKILKSKTSLKNKRVLDIGCGYGALSYALLKEGARVWATETDKEKLAYANTRLSTSKQFTSFLVNEETLPFEDSFFDDVVIFDVIEHVTNPKKTIEEAIRVLKPGGYLYVEFTPYYSFTGHHLYDFSVLPIHMFSKEKIKQIVFTKKVNSFITPQQYWRQFESLNKLRIETFRHMVISLKTVQERYIIKYPEKFELNIPFLKFFKSFSDYLTMSFEGLYQKI